MHSPVKESTFHSTQSFSPLAPFTLSFPPLVTLRITLDRPVTPPGCQLQSPPLPSSSLHLSPSIQRSRNLFVRHRESTISQNDQFSGFVPADAQRGRSTRTFNICSVPSANWSIQVDRHSVALTVAIPFSLPLPLLTAPLSLAILSSILYCPPLPPSTPFCLLSYYCTFCGSIQVPFY